MINVSLMTERQAIKKAEALAERNRIQYRVLRHREDKHKWGVCEVGKEPDEFVWIYTIGRNWKAWH